MNIFLAEYLVMSLFGYGSNGASFDAFSTGSIHQEQAILVMILIGSRGRSNNGINDYASRSHCLPLGGNQSITEPKST